MKRQIDNTTKQLMAAALSGVCLTAAGTAHAQAPDLAQAGSVAVSADRLATAGLFQSEDEHSSVQQRGLDLGARYPALGVDVLVLDGLTVGAGVMAGASSYEHRALGEGSEAAPVGYDRTFMLRAIPRLGYLIPLAEGHLWLWPRAGAHFSWIQSSSEDRYASGITVEEEWDSQSWGVQGELRLVVSPVPQAGLSVGAQAMYEKVADDPESSTWLSLDLGLMLWF